jgi:CubicO group peptidase (beta-lactamase class C family)
MHPIPGSGDRRGPESFGHGGAGGSIGFADPQHRIGFGYAMNQMWAGEFGTIDPRAQLLAGAVYEAMGVATAKD